jgi:hypothetical protein
VDRGKEDTTVTAEMALAEIEVDTLSLSYRCLVLCREQNIFHGFGGQAPLGL